MDPDLASVAAAFSALFLALLGARRRARIATPGHPTAGQQVAERGAGLTRSAATAWNGLGHLAAGVAASAIEVGGMTTGAAVRGVSNVSSTVSTGAAALAGEAVSRAGGLVLDGGLAVTDLLRGRRAR